MPKQSVERDIRVILAGGTIDAEAYEHTPQFVTPTEFSVVPKHMRELAGGYRCEFKEWIRMDSQKFTSEHMDELAHLIAKSEQDKIIITFGTDAMVKWSHDFQDRLAGSGKTVVFVGAMEPLNHGDSSDGLSNLQYSLNRIDELPRGIYMVGRKLGERGFEPELFFPERTEKVKPEESGHFFRDRAERQQVRRQEGAYL